MIFKATDCSDGEGDSMVYGTMHRGVDHSGCPKAAGLYYRDFSTLIGADEFSKYHHGYCARAAWDAVPAQGAGSPIRQPAPGMAAEDDVQPLAGVFRRDR